MIELIELRVCGNRGSGSATLATGDLMARDDVMCNWLTGAGYRFDIANAPPFTDGVDARTVGPKQYSHSIVVCRPFEDYPQRDTRVANVAVERLIQPESAAVIRIDTHLELNSAGRTDWDGSAAFFLWLGFGCLRRTKRGFTNLT